MIRIDTYDDDSAKPGSDWFCYHSSSACILPPGFSTLNGISLTPPKGYSPSTFNWTDYLAETGSAPAPAELFDIVSTFCFLFFNVFDLLVNTNK